jgi:hypothetical protein
MPPASPASTRLQYSASKCLGWAEEPPRQAGAGLHVGPHVGQQLGHARVGGAAADDVEGLQQRHASLHHGGQLAREQRDVLLPHRPAAADAALLQLGQQDALAAQRGTDRGFAAGADFATHHLAVLVAAFPFEDRLLDASCGCCSRHGYSVSGAARAAALAMPRVIGWSPR